MSTINQKIRIMEALQAGEILSNGDDNRNFSVHKLASRISELIDAGIKIKKSWKEINGVRYRCYYL